MQMSVIYDRNSDIGSILLILKILSMIYNNKKSPGVYIDVYFYYHKMIHYMICMASRRGYLHFFEKLVKYHLIDINSCCHSC